MACHLPPSLDLSHTCSSTILEPPFCSLNIPNSLLSAHTFSFPDSLSWSCRDSCFLSFRSQRGHTSKVASYSLPSYRVILIFNTLHHLTFCCQFVYLNIFVLYFLTPLQWNAKYPKSETNVCLVGYIAPPQISGNHKPSVDIYWMNERMSEWTW